VGSGVVTVQEVVVEVVHAIVVEVGEGVVEVLEGVVGAIVGAIVVEVGEGVVELLEGAVEVGEVEEEALPETWLAAALARHSVPDHQIAKVS
jgi:hypothetical protein